MYYYPMDLHFWLYLRETRCDVGAMPCKMVVEMSVVEVVVVS